MSLRADLRELRKTVKDVQRVLDDRGKEKEARDKELEEGSLSSSKTSSSKKATTGRGSPPRAPSRK